MEENPVIEYVHYVRIVEFQAWNNVKGGEQRPFLITYSNPYDASDEMAVRSEYHNVCKYAAISLCDTHTVKVLDEFGNVWMNCQETFQHGHEPEPEATE